MPIDEQRPTTVFLHVGPPKTATTFLQDVMWSCRDELAAAGVTFPGSHFSDHFFASLDVRDIEFGHYDDPRTHGAWDQLLADVRACTTPAVIITHEMFAGASREQVRRIVGDLAPAEVHIIYALRDLGRQLPAVWQEGVKNRWVMAWPDFVTMVLRSRKRPGMFWKAHDVPRVLSRWSEAVPPERIHVVTMPPSGAPKDLFWRRFCSVIGVDPDRFDLATARPNASLSLDQAELLRRLNERLDADLPWPDYQDFVKERFNDLANAGSRGRKVTIPPRFEAAVKRHATRIVDGVARGGYDVTGDLAEAMPTEKSFGRDNTVTGDQLASEAVELIATVVERSATSRRLPPAPVEPPPVSRPRQLVRRAARRVRSRLRR